MTKTTYRGVLVLTFAIWFGACDGRPSPSEPTALLFVPSHAPTVMAISPSTGSTTRPTPVMISGSGFLPGATVTVDVMAGTVSVVNSTTITAIVPARAAGQADVVVTNPGGSGGTLTAAFTYSFHEPFTLTSSTDAVDPGGQMSVSWTAPAARPGDWIAVCKVGGSYEDDWYGLPNGAASGTHSLNAPTRPGQYEFRYLLDDGFLAVARSNPFVVR
jgi:IPT/TIG domain